jgi:hypothetical protein
MQTDRNLRGRRLLTNKSEREYLFQEPAGREELRQGLAMIVAGQPVLTTIRRVDLWVVPLQVVRGGLPTASSGAT